MITGELNRAQLKELQKQLASHQLPPQKRQRLLWRIAKYGVIAAAARNVRNQQDPDGSAWDGRKSKRKGKMLRNMPKLLKIKEMDGAVRIYVQGGNYRSGRQPIPAGVVGYAQQNGMSVTMNRQQVAHSGQQSANATLCQAKRLRALGYQVKKGKRWRKPPYKEIIEKMSMAQAGLLIRELSGKEAKTTWAVEIPSRVFLGISEEDLDKAIARQLQAIGFGFGSNN